MVSKADTRPAGGEFLGHPRGLVTLFLTEMWERFSFYGIQALLVLYLSASVARGGLGQSEGTADALYGLYAGMVYIFSLPGGWLADRVLGTRGAVWWGGIVIACGHFTMAIPVGWSVYAGLALIVLGTGLLKPNVSALLGDLYSSNVERREAGFSIFYMGINVGAFLAPLIVGSIGEGIGWHWGFAVAGVGMVAGLTQYHLGRRHLGDAGLRPPRPLDTAGQQRAIGWTVLALVVGVLITWAAVAAGLTSEDEVIALLGSLSVLAVIGYFVRILADRRLTTVERSRMYAFIWLFVFAAAFWLVVDQAGSVLNTFAQRDTNRDILGFEFPATWFQSVGPLLIVCLAPAFGWLWVRAGERLSTPIKFTFGLILAGFSYVLMAGAAVAAIGGGKVSPWWLVAVYALQVCGELCLSPVGLAITSTLGPKVFAGQMMGLWFLAATVGDSVGGQVSRLSTIMPKYSYFLILGAALVLAGIAAWALSGQVKRLMAGVH